MSDSITIQGNLTLGPQGCCDGGLPAGILQLPISVGECGGKAVATRAYDVRSLTDAAAFVTLGGVGDIVTQGTTLLVRSNAPITLRLTTFGSPDVVAVVPLHGLAIWEFPSSNYLKLLEAKGVAKVEYVVTGQQ